MRMVTPGASHLEVTPIAYDTWQFGGDWESVDNQAALSAPPSARRLAPTTGIPIAHERKGTRHA